MQRLPCSRCGDSIHPDTATLNGGLCRPCAHGNLLTLEQRKELQRRLREEEQARFDSAQARYWETLVDRVHRQPGGFNALAQGDQLYYLINMLGGELDNGGFHQFFSNPSGGRYRETVAALTEVSEQASLALLLEAKSLLFGASDVPVDPVERYHLMPTSSEHHPEYQAINHALEALDQRFYEHSADALNAALERIAAAFHLYHDS